MNGVAVGLNALLKSNSKSKVQPSEVDALGNTKVSGSDDPSSIFGQNKFATPKVSSTTQFPFPRNLQAEHVFVRVTEKLSKESKERGDDFILAQRITEDLQYFLQKSSGFASREDTALVVFDIEVTSAATGSRFQRCWKNDLGFVRLGIDFAIHDQTKPACPILKHGKVVYVNPLKRSSFKDRCGRDSGEQSLMSVLPMVSRQLVGELPIETTYESTMLT